MPQWSARHRALWTIGVTMLVSVASRSPGAEFYVAPQGDDTGEGSRELPFATLARARDAVRASPDRGMKPVTVHLRGGTYYLRETLRLGPEDSGAAGAPVTWRAHGDEHVVISGGMRLVSQWREHRDGIWRAVVPRGTRTDQLFVDGELQVLARHPNFDPNERIFNGYAADAFSTERARTWSDPAGGFIHAMHRNMWGDFHYWITGKDAGGAVVFEGGWQNNRRHGMHATYRFVENIFEELDAPGEWFLDAAGGALYFYPRDGRAPGDSTVEIVRLRHLVELRGNAGQPVSCVSFRNLVFRHAARTFMDTREPLLRSDWTIYRGGAIVLEGTEDCALEDCELDQVGGNGVFVSGYNRRVTIRRCHIARSGANGVAFVGDPGAVRSPLFEYGERQNHADIDTTPGPRTEEYPADCLVEDCLIHGTGRVEKQTAPIQISMARRIGVKHCSLYDVPRAGINISEGTWGGHLIEFCDVFDTVKETGDHGSFNSWGRDRYWGLKDVDLDDITLGDRRDLPLLDAVEPTVLRRNRWRCDHGWDIDLDDGSSNYRIVENLCLNGGIKLREGFYRVCENNIMVGNSFHPHVWYRHSEDVFQRNIVFAPYRPIRVPRPWGKVCDANLLHVPGKLEAEPATALQERSGRDRHSLSGAARFVDPARGDYRLRDDSPALELGFRNFPMDRFGVRTPRLRAIARMPRLPAIESGLPEAERSSREAGRTELWGATVRNVVGMGEVSAYGLPGEIGVLVLEVPPGSAAARLGLRTDDVIFRVDGRRVDSTQSLRALDEHPQPPEGLRLTIYRQQFLETLGVRSGGSDGDVERGDAGAESERVPGGRPSGSER